MTLPARTILPFERYRCLDQQLAIHHTSETLPIRASGLDTVPDPFQLFLHPYDHKLAYPPMRVTLGIIPLFWMADVYMVRKVS